MSVKFVPASWLLTLKLRQFALDKGLSEKQIIDQEERFRDCEFPRPIKDFDRCWRRWIRNGIDWGKIEIERSYELRQPEEITDEQRKIDAAKAVAQMNEYRSRQNG